MECIPEGNIYGDDAWVNIRLTDVLIGTLDEDCFKPSRLEYMFQWLTNIHNVYINWIDSDNNYANDIYTDTRDNVLTAIAIVMDVFGEMFEPMEVYCVKL